MTDMNTIVKAAFKCGAEQIEYAPDSGYHFRVHTCGGHVAYGCPDDWDGSGLLYLDNVAGGDTKIIPQSAIEFIEVVSV